MHASLESAMAGTQNIGVLQFSSIRPEPQSQPKRPELPPELPVSWLNNVLPAKVLPYAYLMRLDKPIGKAIKCSALLRDA